MADKKSSDPATAWRDMLGDWEKNVNAFANKAMEKEEFVRLMGAFSGATATAQGAMGGAMERYLSTLNLPSRADLTAVGERLSAIEAQVRQIAELVQTIPGVSASAAQAEPEAPKPSRTRKPSSAAS